MDNVSNRIASLSPDERSALVMRLKRKAQGAEKVVDNKIRPRDNRIDAPLSLAQQRLWFLHQLDPANDPYYLPFYFRLTGPLNVAALECCLNEIIRRHEILRTVFKEKNSEVVQIVLPSFDLALPLFDLSELPKREADQEIKLLIDAESARSFDLEQGPLLRALLLRRSSEEHGFFLVVHHIVMDGWSMDIFMGELVALYEAFSANQPSPLAELPLQYADFAAWQREWIKKGVLDEQLAYWKKQLNGDLPMLEAPTDHSRPPRMTYHGADGPFDLPQDLIEQLTELGQREGATLYMTLMAALLTLFHRYTGQDDIILGTATAGRNHSEIEKLIGFFINTLVLRTDLSGNPSFRELIGRVREVALGAYEHQDVPFEKLVEELQPERDTSRQPFFQVMVNFQTAPAYELTAGEVKISPQDVGDQTRFDLELHLWVVPQGVTGNLIYNIDLFEQSTIARMLKHFERLLEGIAANPEARLSELPMLTREEQEQFRAWNATSNEYPVACIQQLFEAQVARTPDAVAVVLGEEQVSYEELNRRANQLARTLRQKGVGPGVRVGVLMQHAPEEIASLLAIIKAGGAYVPLEPAHPAKRLEFIISDAQLELILTQSRIAAKAPASTAEILAVDAEDESIDQAGDTNLTHIATPDEIAYVIYTSGSTGQPKGVNISHRALVNYVWWAKDAYLQNENLGFALYSSLAFDLTVTSIYVPLISGNKIVIHLGEGEEARPEPPLARMLSDTQVGILKLTPSHLSLIKEWDGGETSVKRLIVGGEALSTELTRQVCKRLGGQVEVFNEYGPTEATVGCMIYQFNAEQDTRSSVPIGWPAANVQIYVLDRWLQPVADNVTGELYIAGDGMAQGYLNRPDLTAERFIANPFTPGERMYRTGDLCRRLPSGELEYLGRQDEQVKFHGYRVELNEIRWALKKHPQIREGVVAITKDQNGYDVMVAYYVSRQELDVAQLRGFLSEVLIEETIPNIFVHLQRLPLTLNGKVNYEALPTLDDAKQKLNRTYTAPATPAEEILASIWADVLGLERVGIYNNFFDLGGHSLLATRVISRIRETCGVQLPLRLLFDCPTVAALATHLAAVQPRQTDAGRIAEILGTLASLSEDETKTLLEQSHKEGFQVKSAK